MDLIETSIAPSLKKTGVDQFEVAAGKKLKIETAPDGAEILKITVPAGKKWTVWVNVDITESDA